MNGRKFSIESTLPGPDRHRRTAKGNRVRELSVTPRMSTQDVALPSTREKFSCSGDQFEIIVAFAESHGLLQAPFHFVVSEYKRTKLH
jgi:hypothetical protein